MRLLKRYCVVVLAVILPVLLYAQAKKDEDRLVRLMSAQSVSNTEKNGRVLRQAEGPARFLHNDTWLVCDTALWDVDAKIIYAMGNVSIEQENTELRSDKLTYYIDRDLAEFRGTLVELVDKDMNTLRTHNLDYNTKDSVAVFRSGASMRSKDGQIIESLDGTYDSKIELFTFENKVNMFSDSVFVNTSRLFYDSGQSLATFPNYVDAWNEDRMLSGSSGYYDNVAEKFFLKGKVHTMDSEKEGWCDSLYFYRQIKTLDMFGNAQLTDTTRNVTGLAGFISYRDSLKYARMTDEPLVMMEMEEKDEDRTVRDTVYMRANLVEYWKPMRFQLDSASVKDANARLEILNDDPIANIRKKAAEEAAKQRQAVIDNDPNAPFELKSPEAQEKILKTQRGNQAGKSKEQTPPEEKNGESETQEEQQEPQAQETEPETAEETQDNSGEETVEDPGDEPLGAVLPPLDSTALTIPADSTLLAIQSDSLQVESPLDSIVIKRSAADSVEIGFMRAVGTIKVFRKSMQMVCDSLEYSDLDSLARLYKDPIVWNKSSHQYNSDSIFVLIRNNKMDRANLLSNAFIHIEEVSEKFYDQIKATEMTAFFDENGELRRFDAMGGASAIFYMKEKEEIATANKSESTIMTANFNDGELDSISYFENPSSSAFPVPQMKQDDKYLKGFLWKPQARPTGVQDLSPRKARKSQRANYLKRPRADFKQTEKYFSGYMQSIYRQIEISDSLKKVNEERARLAKERRDEFADSTLAAGLDSLALADSLGTATDSLTLAAPVAGADSLALENRPEIGAAADSLGNAPKLPDAVEAQEPVKTAQEIKAEQKARKQAEREARRKAAEEKREARWNALDTKEALKQAAKDAKKRKKEEKKLRAQVKKLEKEKAREDALIRKYRDRYLKKQRKNL